MRRCRPKPGLLPLTADLGHRPVAVAPTRAVFPRLELCLDVSRALAGDGGNPWRSLAGRAVARRALGGKQRRAANCAATLLEGKRGVIGSDCQPFVGIHRSRDRPHLRMGAKAFDIVGELPDQIALVETRQPRSQVAIALTLQAMARCTRTFRSGITARQRHYLTGGPVSSRPACVGRTGGENGDKGQDRCQLHSRWNRLGETAVPSLMGKGAKFGIAATMAALAACKPAPDNRHQLDSDAAKRGRAVIERVQCGSCHVIPGVDWPKGRLGPSLVGMDQQGLVAGTFPNTPQNLAAFIRNAPAVKPGTVMPAMPIDNREARDVAQYLIEESKR